MRRRAIAIVAFIQGMVMATLVVAIVITGGFCGRCTARRSLTRRHASTGIPFCWKRRTAARSDASDLSPTQMPATPSRTCSSRRC
ncbi:hypothetical protein V1290_000247 [Bradyrhizobium sp. AZCC 1578]|uniref:hypothetical protein n=1 Tax=Bradyrhizobium sp. AZCC 1578 TaxID=3117027 RepID=UPI002FF3A94C